MQNGVSWGRNIKVESPWGNGHLNKTHGAWAVTLWGGAENSHLIVVARNFTRARDQYSAVMPPEIAEPEKSYLSDNAKY